ncbi:DUF6325 family protein [Mycolicibacterium hodleri]|uniref:DUF1269 domain-containing family protein n=1 Tax=Mycolicibacterium hodleri TaxID=49897 RepID=A0A502E865_9MYCO|nr:DUF6325 family protein [Mycolicibacterium hodleri]TPG33072.1 hypothetical protein EAH80_16880 [Mycolicibacterium hodleri]
MHEDRFGPVEHIVVEFTDGATVQTGFDRLLVLADAGLIRVLDLEFVTAEDGAARVIPASAVAAALGMFDGASSGLLDHDDIEAIAARLTPGTTAAVLVYEDLSILDVLAAWESGGATVVSEGHVDVDDIDAALEGV